MNTFELLKELSEKPEEELDFALVCLMLKKKIDFVKVSNAYTEALKRINEDQLDKLIEAETCVSMCFFNKLGWKSDLDKTVTQRCLYLLNKSRRFNMQKLNEKYHYDENKGKEASWYEQTKDYKQIFND